MKKNKIGIIVVMVLMMSLNVFASSTTVTSTSGMTVQESRIVQICRSESSAAIYDVEILRYCRDKDGNFGCSPLDENSSVMNSNGTVFTVVPIDNSLNVPAGNVEVCADIDVTTNYLTEQNGTFYYHVGLVVPNTDTVFASGTGRTTMIAAIPIPISGLVLLTIVAIIAGVSIVRIRNNKKK